VQIEISACKAGKILQASAGENLYHVLAKAGLLDAPCGALGRCGKCRVRFTTRPPAPLPREIDLLSASDLADGWRLSCLHQINDKLQIELPQNSSATIVHAFLGDSCDLTPDAASGCGLAVDIGTTTVAVSLVNSQNGAQLAASSCLNSQKTFGQDVISRIHYAQSAQNGISELQAAVIADIKTVLSEVCAAAGLKTEQIAMASVAANPTMVHCWPE